MLKPYFNRIIKLALIYLAILLVPFFYLLPSSISALTPVGGSGGGGTSSPNTTSSTNNNGCPTSATSGAEAACSSQCANGTGSSSANCIQCSQEGETAATNSQGCGDSAASTCNKSSCDFIGDYVNPAINLLSALFGLIAVISIIIGGIQFSASAGDPQRAAAAKARISKAIFAIFAYAFLYAFLQFIVPGGIFNNS